MTDNEHQHNPAEEGCHGVVPPVCAGDGVVKVGVPQICYHMHFVGLSNFSQLTKLGSWPLGSN